MPFSTVFIDLDDTLYPASTGLWPVLKGRISLYMHQRLDIPLARINSLREEYFHKYGTTLRGLQANYAVDMNDYLAFVHDVPLRDYLHPDPALRLILKGLTVKRIIFTNADRAHAGRVINALGLDGCFDAIVDVYSVAPYCKPMQESFAIALRIAGETVPGNCILVDDLANTTRAARQFGIFTVLFGQNTPHPDADASLASLLDLPAYLAG